MPTADFSTWLSRGSPRRDLVCAGSCSSRWVTLVAVNVGRHIPEVVYVMGNSIEIAKRHYVREVSKEWMEKFWALKPTP